MNIVEFYNCANLKLYKGVKKYMFFQVKVIINITQFFEKSTNKT